MKKMVKLFIVIFCVLLLVGCKDKKGYEAIEITGDELLKALINEEKIIYATVNPNTTTGQNFIRDLKRIAKENHTDIYYADNTKIKFITDESIYIINGVDTRKNAIFYNGEEEIAIAYESYNSLHEVLKDIKGDEIKEIVPDTEKEKYLESAKEAYNNGDLATSLEFLSDCWTLKEAKDFYKNNQYYKLINEWQYTSKGQKEINIKKLTIFSFVNVVYTYEYKGPEEDYKEPQAGDYNDIYYLIKDNNIYVNDEKEDYDNYKLKYKIISLSDDELILEENKNQTVYKVNKKESSR